MLHKTTSIAIGEQGKIVPIRGDENKMRREKHRQNEAKEKKRRGCHVFLIN